MCAAIDITKKTSKHLMSAAPITATVRRCSFRRQLATTEFEIQILLTGEPHRRRRVSCYV